MPLRDVDLDAMVGCVDAQGVPPFNSLSAQLAALRAEFSNNGPNGYIETGYHGGDGRQRGALFENEALKFQSYSKDTLWPETIGPVNRVLKALGVKRRTLTDDDEWEVVGLTRRALQPKCGACKQARMGPAMVELRKLASN